MSILMRSVALLKFLCLLLDIITAVLKEQEEEGITVYIGHRILPQEQFIPLDLPHLLLKCTARRAHPACLSVAFKNKISVIKIFD